MHLVKLGHENYKTDLLGAGLSLSNYNTQWSYIFSSQEQLISVSSLSSTAETSAVHLVRSLFIYAYGLHISRLEAYIFNSQNSLEEKKMFLSEALQCYSLFICSLPWLQMDFFFPGEMYLKKWKHEHRGHLDNSADMYPFPPPNLVDIFTEFFLRRVSFPLFKGRRNQSDVYTFQKEAESAVGYRMPPLWSLFVCNYSKSSQMLSSNGLAVTKCVRGQAMGLHPLAPCFAATFLLTFLSSGCLHIQGANLNNFPAQG